VVDDNGNMRVGHAMIQNEFLLPIRFHLIPHKRSAVTAITGPANGQDLIGSFLVFDSEIFSSGVQIMSLSRSKFILDDC
jgi:hypothetical protein